MGVHSNLLEAHRAVSIGSGLLISGGGDGMITARCATVFPNSGEHFGASPEGTGPKTELGASFDLPRVALLLPLTSCPGSTVPEQVVGRYRVLGS